MNIFEQFKFRKLIIGYRYDMVELSKKIADLDTDGNFEKIDTALATIVNGLQTDYIDVEPTIYDFEVLDFMEGYVKKFESHYIKSQATIGKLFNENFEICVIALKNLITSYKTTPKVETTVDSMTIEFDNSKPLVEYFIESEQKMQSMFATKNSETVTEILTHIVEEDLTPIVTEIVETDGETFTSEEKDSAVVEISEEVKEDIVVDNTEVLPNDTEIVETPVEVVEEVKTEEVVEEAEKPKKSTKKSK